MMSVVFDYLGTALPTSVYVNIVCVYIYKYSYLNPNSQNVLHTLYDFCQFIHQVLKMKKKHASAIQLCVQKYLGRDFKPIRMWWQEMRLIFLFKSRWFVIFQIF